MGEDLKEADCADIIAAATQGLEEIDFECFHKMRKAQNKPPDKPPRKSSKTVKYF